MCDCEYPEFYREKLVTSKKQRKCCECSLLIDCGDNYYYCCGKWDGDVSGFHLCPDCWSLSRWLSKENDCCVPFGNLYEELRESNVLRKTKNEPEYIGEEWVDKVELIGDRVKLIQV